MKPNMTSALRLGVFLVAAGGLAHAQFPTAQEDPAEAEKLRRYTVELIIFEYAENVGLGSEIFVAELAEPEPDIIDALPEAPSETEPDIAGTDEEPVGIDLAIQALPRDELTLIATLERLERLDAYRPLMHFGWTQATVAEELSPELPLARFGAPPEGLDGDLKLYLNRFLHLVVDVSKLAPDSVDGSAVGPRQAVIDAPADRYDSTSERNAFDRDFIIEEYEPLRYRINEDRIMKNGETRYYDHPKIGVIAKVTRVEEEEDDSVSAGF